jgi:hypothetical protein
MHIPLTKLSLNDSGQLTQVQQLVKAFDAMSAQIRLSDGIFTGKIASNFT